LSCERYIGFVLDYEGVDVKVPKDYHVRYVEADSAGGESFAKAVEALS
jgi:hypothetical protein